jgi:hypothetical protein
MISIPYKVDIYTILLASSFQIYSLDQILGFIAEGGGSRVETLSGACRALKTTQQWWFSNRLGLQARLP